MSVDVLVVGEDRRHSLGRMCMRGVESLGLEAIFVDKTPINLYNVKFPGSDWLLKRSLLRAMDKFTPDIVLVVKGNNLDKKLVTKVGENSDVFVCNWNPDNPFEARSEERILSNYLESGPEYNVCFTWSRSLADELKNDYDFDRVEFLPFAYDPEIHRPTSPDPEYECDVIFAGIYSEKREKVLSELVTAGIDVSIRGSYWKRKCDKDIENAVEGGKLLGEEYAKAYSSSKIAINILADHNLDDHNMRTFEIPATRTLMMTTDTTGQREFFDENEAVYYSSPSELIDKVEYYLERDEERMRIAKNGHEAVQNHTYETRMKDVLDVYRSEVTGV